MTATRVRTVGSVALGLSLLAFAIFFINVLVGGPLRMKPFMSDLGEMLTLLLAVALFVAGTISRETEANLDRSDRTDATAAPDPADGRR